MTAGTTAEALWLHLHEPSYWLRNAIDDLRRLQTGKRTRLKGCAHIAAGTAPYAVTWLHSPLLVACTECLCVVPDPKGEERWRCDRCGEINVEGCSAMVAWPLPHLAVCFGLCADCRAAEVGS